MKEENSSVVVLTELTKGDSCSAALVEEGDGVIRGKTVSGGVGWGGGEASEYALC